MRFKWGFISILFILFILSFSFASANDLDNQTINMENKELISVDDTSNYNSFSELGKVIYSAKDGDNIIFNDSYIIDDNSSTIYISKSITLDGNGATIDADGKTRIFTIAADNVVLKNIKFINGNYNVGGAISWSGNQGTIENCIFEENTATRPGGAIFWNANNGKIIDSTFNSNNAGTSGGAVSIEGNNFLISGNNFENNNGELGGAIRIMGNNQNVTNNIFKSNIAKTGGGGLRIEGNHSTITKNEFYKNSAKGTLGGALLSYGNYTLIEDNFFKDNDAERDGGAIDIEGGIETDEISIPGIENKIKNNTFIGGSARYGGAISFNGKLGTITENTFTNNHAYELGGAIRWAGYSDATGSITNNIFSDNDADISGGAIFIKGNKSTITDNTFTNHKSNGAGGTITIHGDDGKISDNKFSNTNATRNGGAIYANGSKIDISNNEFKNTKADSTGGAIYLEGHSAIISKNIIDNAQSKSNGGAISLTSHDAKITDNTIKNSIGESNGGALRVEGNNVLIDSNQFINNKATTGLAGAINVNGNNAIINKNNFTKNTAKSNGGAVYIKGSGSTISDNNFDSNTADNTGGALRVENGDNTNINGNEFNKNIAKSNGGAINIDGAKLTVTNNKFYENEAQNEKLGGAIWFKGDNADINSNTFKGNTAKTGTAINGETSSTKVIKNTFINSVETDKTLIRLVGDNNDVRDNIYTTVDRTVKLTMNDVTVYYGGTQKLIATLTDSASKPLANKKVIINFENKNNEMTTDSKGQVSIDIKDLSIGTYKATATFAGDADYDASKATATVTVKSTIEAKDLTAEIGNVNYNATFFDTNGKPLAKGEYVSFTVEGDVYRVQVGSNGVATATFDKRIGEYNIRSTNTVTGETTKNKLKITKASTKITMKDVEIYYGGSQKLIATLTDTNSKPIANKNITINLNKKDTILTTNEKGQVSLDIKDLNKGTYQATATFTGDQDYNKNTVTSTVTAKTTIEAKDLITTYGNVKYNATFLDSNGKPLAKGESVSFTINNNIYNAKIEDNGIATISLKESAGEYKVNILNTKTGETTTNKIKINKASPNLNAVVKDIEEGSDAVFDITSDSQSGLVILNINKIDYNATLEKGKAKIIVSNLTGGKYPYSIKYMSNDNYTEQSVTGNINVKSTNIIISASDVTKYYKGSERLTVTLTDKTETPLKDKIVFITINGRTYNRTTNDKGIASIALELPSNNYTANIAFKGDADYKAVNTTCKVEIKPTVFGKDITKIEKASKPYTATFLDSTGKPLTIGTEIKFNINGVFYDRIIRENGQAKLNLNLEAKTYIITAINTITGEQSSNNITIQPRIVNNSDVTKYFKNGTQYYVTLLDDNGKPVKAGENVTFNINGVFYTRQTNENGTAKLNINLEPKNYVITAEYKGCKASNNIKVLPVLSANDITIKENDKSQFEVKLVDGQGKAYAKQTIDFNINGVLYHRVTDENGIARLNIRLMAGKYIITSSYNGSNIANTITIIS